MNINRITISGNLVADPTFRETNSGPPVASVTIANNESFNDGEGERQQVTTFVDVTVWGKSGENFAFLAKRGQEVIIEGQLRRNDRESEDGQKHSKRFLRAGNWQFTQYRRQEESTEVAPEKAPKRPRKPLLNTPGKSFSPEPGGTHTTPPEPLQHTRTYSEVMSLYSNYLPKSRGAAALSDEELWQNRP
jgi:single-strand DNA-binding protein